MLAFDPNDPGMFSDLVPQANRAPSAPAAPQAPLRGPPRAPPEGYQPQAGGLAPIPGGPQDPRRPGGPLDPEAQMSPQAIDLQADRYLMTGELPPLGIGGAGGARQRILNRAAERAAAASHGAGDLATQTANYRALRTTLQNQQTQLANIQAQEQTTSNNLDALAHVSHGLPGQTETPLVNSAVHMAQQNSGLVPGHAQVSAYKVAYDTAINEYARLISMGSSGNGQLTDAARAEAQRMIPYGSGPEALDAAIQQARVDMANRRSSYEQTVAHLQAQIAGRDRITASGSGVIGPAGMLSGHPTGPVPPLTGSGGPPMVGGGSAPGGGSPAGGIARGIGAGQPADHSGDAVVFGMDRTPPPPPPNAGPLPGGAEFAGALQAAIRTGQFHSVAEAMQFAHNLNPYLAQTVNQADLAAAIRNPALAGVAVPHGSPPAPPPPPDISGQRGDQADPRQIAIQNAMRRSIYNNLGGGGPMIAGPSGIAEMVSGPEAGAAALRGSEDVASVGLAPRMNALSDTIGQGGTYQGNLDQQQAIDNFDTSNHPFARFGGEAVTGAPFAMLGGASVGRQMIASGGYGFAHGFNSGQGTVNDRLDNAVLQGSVGAALPVAGAAVSAGARAAAPYLGRAVGWVAGRARPNVTPAGQEIAAAGQAENVHVSGPMLDPSTRSRMAYLESSLGGGGPVNQSLDATQAAIQNRMAQISGPGAAGEAGAMGERVQAAGRRYVAASGQRIGAMYQRAAQMAGDTPIIPVQAVQRLEGHIADLQQNPGQNAPLINFLNTIRGDLLDRTGALAPKTVQAIRDMRTNLRGNIAQANLTHTPAERIMSDVLDGARQDVNVFLGSVNPAANKLYQQADQQWAGRHAEITQIVDRLVGRADNPLGGGTVMDRVSSLAAGDVPRLQRVLSMLSPEERADLQATIASRAGYKSPDEPFNLQQFVSWQRALPNGAREAIFGADGAASIRNLTVLARALQDTRGALNNSRSGQVQNWAATLRGFLGGHWPSLAAGAGAGYGSSSAIAAGATTAALTGAGAVMRRLSAKALMNPDLSAWLPGALRASTPAAVRSALGRLSGIAARNPAIAQEVTGLRQALSGANDNFGTAAAASGADSQPQYGNDQAGYAPRQ